MSDPQWQRVRELLFQALQLDDEAARRRFIGEACGPDVALRSEVESLLQANSGMHSAFLDRSAGAGFEAPPGGELAVGEAFAGNFVLLRLLGEGGMGQVWLAEQTSPVRRQVAIKLIRAGMYDASTARRFQTERQMLAIMDHAAIAKVFEAGTTALGQPYLVMEYVPGVPITDYCDQHRLGIRERLELFIAACAGVQHAHHKAILHRDLKPANILVVEVDGRPVPRIIDFGLAKSTAPSVADDGLTRLGFLLGTPGYMSPEQLDANVADIDTRTDVYSLGVVLYVLLCGLLPFESSRRPKPDVYELARAVREGGPPSLSAKLATERARSLAAAAARGTDARRLVKALRGDLDWITQKALEADRARRYGTPAELAADLRHYLDHEPISARPASRAYQIGRYLRRHRLAAGAVTLVVCSLAVGLGLALWQTHEARQAAREARAQELRARHLSALSSEQAGDAASQLAQPDVALAQLANAVRLEPDDPALRAELLLTLEEQRTWWLPRNAPLAATAIDYAAFGHDASRIVTADQGDTVRVWNADSGVAIGPAITHKGLNGLDLSPDGTRLVTSSRDGTAKIWDLRAPSAPIAILEHPAPVMWVTFDPKGERVVTTSEDHVARIWNANTGAAIGAPLKHAGTILYAEMSRDGRFIVTASRDSTARVWDARSGRALGAALKHDDGVNRAHFSSDGSRVVTTSWDRTARLWDARTGKPLGEPMRHVDPLMDAAFSLDGGRLFTADQDGTVRAWDVPSGRPLGPPVRLALEFHAAAFDADGRLLVTTDPGRTVQVWRQRHSAPPIERLERDNPATFIAFDSRGERLVTNSAHHGAQVWNAHTGQLLLPALQHDGLVAEASFSRDDALIVTASMDHTARVWDAKSGEPLGVPMRHPQGVYQARFNRDGTIVLTLGLDGQPRLWKARTGELIAELHASQPHVYSSAFMEDGRIVFTASGAFGNPSHESSDVQVWDAASGSQIGRTIHYDTAISTFARSPDSSRIAVSSDGTTRIWDVHTGLPIGAPMKQPSGVGREAFSPDGTRLVTTGEDTSARLWDAHTGAPLGREMRHGAIVLRALFSPDGRQVLTASGDFTGHLWDGRTGAPIGEPMRHGGTLWSALFSADGERIVTASTDHTARIWDARTTRALSGPIHTEWPLYYAAFSPDAHLIYTLSFDRQHVRLWPVVSATEAEAPQLTELAEAVGGFRVDPVKGIVPVSDRLAVLEKLLAALRAHPQPLSDTDRLIREFAGPEEGSAH